MKVYEFTITLTGKGMCAQSAWEDAFDAFSVGFESPDDDQTKVIGNCCGDCACTEEDEELFYAPSVGDYLCQPCAHKKGLSS